MSLEVRRSTWERFRLIALPTEARRSAFARDVAAGLTACPKRLSCCYFYDADGSRLFEDICELPEYYLTRAERAILERHAGEIADCFQEPTTLVELGSGNAAKTRLLIAAFLERLGGTGWPPTGDTPRPTPAGGQPVAPDGVVQRYVPVDICRTVLEDSSLELLQAFPRLEILAVAAEYQEALRHLKSEADRPKLVLWLGSNIGNFARAEAAAFLRQVRATLSPGDRLLVGIDLRKDRSLLEPAYDDAQGVTAQFNKNLLARINRELGGRFDPQHFRHLALYNDPEGRIEIYLVSTRRQQVSIDELRVVVSFAEGERIHTEDSYKYALAEIDELARAAGLTLLNQWSDPDGLFSENLFGPAA